MLILSKSRVLVLLISWFRFQWARGLTSVPRCVRCVQRPGGGLSQARWCCGAPSRGCALLPLLSISSVSPGSCWLTVPLGPATPWLVFCPPGLPVSGGARKSPPARGDLCPHGSSRLASRARTPAVRLVVSSGGGGPFITAWAPPCR